MKDPLPPIVLSPEAEAELRKMKREQEAERNKPRTMKDGVHWRRPSAPRDDFEEIAHAGGMLTALLSKMQVKIDELEKRLANIETRSLPAWRR